MNGWGGSAPVLFCHRCTFRKQRSLLQLICCLAYVPDYRSPQTDGFNLMQYYCEVRPWNIFCRIKCHKTGSFCGKSESLWMETAKKASHWSSSHIFSDIYSTWPYNYVLDLLGVATGSVPSPDSCTVTMRCRLCQITKWTDWQHLLPRYGILILREYRLSDISVLQWHYSNCYSFFPFCGVFISHQAMGNSLCTSKVLVTKERSEGLCF